MARKAAANGNGRRLATQQSLNGVVKSVCDIQAVVPGAHEGGPAP